MNNPKNTRMCFVCRTRLPKSELIKLVVQDRELKVDTEQNENSRGMYICNKKECIESIYKRKNIEGAIKNSFRNKTLNVTRENLVNLLESQKRG